MPGEPQRATEPPAPFVVQSTSVSDGTVAIPSVPRSNKLIAAGNPADRFVMGLLRACADALVVGSATVAASPRGLWTAAQAYPDAAEAFGFRPEDFPRSLLLVGPAGTGKSLSAKSIAGALGAAGIQALEHHRVHAVLHALRVERGQDRLAGDAHVEAHQLAGGIEAGGQLALRHRVEGAVRHEIGRAHV